MYICIDMHVIQAGGRHRGVDAVQARVGVVGAFIHGAVGEVVLVDFNEIAHVGLEVVPGRVPAELANQCAVSVELVGVGVPVSSEVGRMVWVVLDGAVDAREDGSTGCRV